MEGMSVIGNSELPKALFIVPWKEPEASLTPERPVNSLVDEVLQPVDPELPKALFIVPRLFTGRSGANWTISTQFTKRTKEPGVFSENYQELPRS